MKITASIKTKFQETCTLSDALVLFRGNQSELARSIGVHRGTIRNYIKNESNPLFLVVRDGSEILEIKLINKGILK